MTFPVLVQPTDGQFAASLLGAPELSATGATREKALTLLEAELTERCVRGELVTLEVPRRGLAGLFGKYRDDPTLRDICAEAYRERAADVTE